MAWLILGVFVFVFVVGVVVGLVTHHAITQKELRKAGEDLAVSGLEMLEMSIDLLRECADTPGCKLTDAIEIMARVAARRRAELAEKHRGVEAVS